MTAGAPSRANTCPTTGNSWPTPFFRTPIGGPLVGWLMAVIGARAGLGIGAITCFVVALAGLAALRGLPRRAHPSRVRTDL